MNPRKILESAGSLVFGLLVFLVPIGLLLFFIKGSPWLIANVLPVLLGVCGFAWVLNVVLLPFSISKKLGKYLWFIFFASSIVYGVSAWLIGFAYTVYFYGIFWFILGVLFFGIGVVPIGLFGLATHNQWSDFWQLLILFVSTYVARFIAIWMAERADSVAGKSARASIPSSYTTTEDMNHQDVKPHTMKHKPVNLELFAISPLRLAFLSVITLGLYETYWFYRNWKALMEVDSDIRHPVWRAIFSVFYCYSLFKKTLSAARRLGYKKSYKAGILATIYIVFLVLGNAWGKSSELDKGTDITLMIILSLSFLPLLAIQKAVNFINHKQNKTKETKLRIGEVFIIIIGMLLCGLAVSYTVFSPHTQISPENQKQAADLKSKIDSLSAQYDTCSKDLEQRHTTIDTTSQMAVDSYNADYDSCESVRQQQNQAVDDYNRLIQGH